MTGPWTAVVCEDDQVLLAALRRVLTGHGFRVLAWVHSGSELAAAVEEHEPAVVVVDAALLGAQGIALLARLRAGSARRLVVLCPSGLELRDLAEDADLVVPVDDLRPLRQWLVELASPAAAGWAGAIGVQRQGEHERGTAVGEVSAVCSGDTPGDGQA